MKQLFPKSLLIILKKFYYFNPLYQDKSILFRLISNGNTKCLELRSKPPLFKILEIDKIIKNVLKNYRSTTPLRLNYKKYVVAQEIYKLLMNQITSLKELHF